MKRILPLLLAAAACLVLPAPLATAPLDAELREVADIPGEPHFPRRIFYYFSIHLRVHPRPSLVLDVSDHLEAKMRAVACYQSQLVTGRPTEPPTLLDDVRDRARYWGWAIGTAYGEPFDSHEPVALTSMRDLL